MPPTDDLLAALASAGSSVTRYSAAMGAEADAHLRDIALQAQLRQLQGEAQPHEQAGLDALMAEHLRGVSLGHDAAAHAAYPAVQPPAPLVATGVPPRNPMPQLGMPAPQLGGLRVGGVPQLPVFASGIDAFGQPQAGQIPASHSAGAQHGNPAQPSGSAFVTYMAPPAGHAPPAAPRQAPGGARLRGWDQPAPLPPRRATHGLMEPLTLEAALLADHGQAAPLAPGPAYQPQRFPTPFSRRLATPSSQDSTPRAPQPKRARASSSPNGWLEINLQDAQGNTLSTIRVPTRTVVHPSEIADLAGRLLAAIETFLWSRARQQ